MKLGCINCGSVIEQNAKYCYSCGHITPTNKDIASLKKKENIYFYSIITLCSLPFIIWNLALVIEVYFDEIPDLLLSVFIFTPLLHITSLVLAIISRIKVKHSKKINVIFWILLVLVGFELFLLILSLILAIYFTPFI